MCTSLSTLIAHQHAQIKLFARDLKHRERALSLGIISIEFRFRPEGDARLLQRFENKLEIELLRI